MPTSQCIVCHVHPGTNVMNSYWWLYVVGNLIRSQMSNPDEAAARGLWSDPEFLANITDLNPQLQHTQFADFHGHGWVFRAAYKKDRKGNLLDDAGNKIENVTTEKLAAAMKAPEQVQTILKEHAQAGDFDPKLRKADGVPVHLMDIHLEKGMHCADCHFNQDVHGNTKLQTEVGGIETSASTATEPRPSGRCDRPAAAYTSSPAGGATWAYLRTPWQAALKSGRQDSRNSMVDGRHGLGVTQVVDTIQGEPVPITSGSALATPALRRAGLV